jgi:hypothetical protein
MKHFLWKMEMSRKTNAYLCVFFGLLISCNSHPSITFTAIGDVPYTEEQYQWLRQFVESHNTENDADLVIHLGDIKSGTAPCHEEVYKEVSSILKELTVPTFVLPGDNEWNDCADTDLAWTYWVKYLYHFHENWPSLRKIEYQPGSAENFHWIEGGVLFAGFNLVGGRIVDSVQWHHRLTQNAAWLRDLLGNPALDIEAAVIFGHANMVGTTDKFRPFTDNFIESARKFEKPILFLHGDGHIWIEDKPWSAQNITRVQVDFWLNGPAPLKVTIDLNSEMPFILNREYEHAD